MDTQLQSLHKIRAEYKQITQQKKVLLARKKELETIIQEYLIKNDLPRVTSNNISIISNQRKTRKRLSKVEKTEQALELLKNLSINNPKKVWEDLQESMRGEPEIIPCIHVKDLV